MSLAYFPMYPDDFEADTAHLTLAEDGAYNRLLRLCWRTPGCSIPADRQWVYRRLRALSDEDRAVINTVLDEFFVEQEGRFSNARLMKEWLAANEAHDRRKKAGSKGGKNKALKTNEIAPSNAQAKPKQPEPEPEPEVREDTNVSSRRKPSPDDGFADFWNIWPSKKNKEAARKAWRKISLEDKRAAFAAIRDGWFERWRQTSPDASPIHAATFLNARRWEDQAETPRLRAINGGMNDQDFNCAAGATERRPHRADPALEQIARLARLGEA